MKDWYALDLTGHNRMHPWEQAALQHLWKKHNGIHVLDEWMFREQEGQFLRHLCHMEGEQRIPYFKQYLIQTNIPYSTCIQSIVDTMYVKFNTYTLTKQLYMYVGSKTSDPIKHIKVLVTILTSSEAGILEVCLQSITRQKYTQDLKQIVTFHPVIIVNTLNPDYAETVRQRFGVYNVPIIETESNGRPGKGHNSEIDYFKIHQEYDWILPVDGDDVLYPTAFMQLAKIIPENKFDVLLFLGLDIVKWNARPGNIAITKGVYLNTIYSQTNLLETEIINNPFACKSIDKLTCPVRMCLLNRAAASSQKPSVSWDEDSVMLEDYPPFLAVFQHHLLGSLRLAATSNRYLYLYNQLTDKNVTTSFIQDVITDKERLENATNIFHRSLEQFDIVRNNWETIRNIPFLSMEIAPAYDQSIPEKIVYLQNTFAKYYFYEHLKQMELLYSQKQWQEFMNKTQIMFDRFPELIKMPLMSLLRENLGECWFQLGDLKNAQIQLATALHYVESMDSDRRSIILKKIEVIQHHMALL
jgi:tetratricopeptide (TPR) repeat protein